jgi:hypothetical protein
MFQWLLHSFDIKNVYYTAKNLQLNSICERMHQTVGNVLRKECYSTAIHRKIWHRPETLSTRHWQLQCTPCELQQPPHLAAYRGLSHSAETCSWMSRSLRTGTQ